MNMQYQNRTLRAAFAETYKNIEIIALKCVVTMRMACNEDNVSKLVHTSRNEI